jgi:superfamily II DNA or RNA helicase
LHSVAKRSEIGVSTKFAEAYRTDKGKMFHGRIEDALDSSEIEKIKGKVNLILTSPPFPLVRKKRYGNETGEVYLSWLESLAGRLADLLTDDGSIVIEMGNAWEQGSPVMSTLPIEALLAFKKAANRHELHFDSLWSETDADIEVFAFPTKAAEHLKKSAFRGLQDLTVDRLPLPETRRSALPHQSGAIDEWTRRGRRGIFEHATGSGKTFTAILAIRRQVTQGLPTIVLVPSRLLLEQWAQELRDEIPDAALLLAGAGNDNWRSYNRLRSMTDPDTELGGRIVLSTMQTASMPEFIANVASGDHLLVVADEVHQVGSPQNSKIMSVSAGGRLGLSATPIRYGDPEGTAKIFAYFGDVVPPKITLMDAVAAGRLVPYEYHPHPINLTATEAAEWKDLTKAIQFECMRQKADENGKRPLSEKAKMLLIRRARVAKKAAAKVGLAVDVIKANFETGQSWLVYCEDSGQLADVISKLSEAGFASVEYHSSMTGDRDATMSWFRSYGGILVSIRCLDEGVDIPAVSHALILASSQNPRQFIQRRGRVLRRSPGKEIASSMMR